MIAYFNLFLWLTEVKIYPIMLVQNVMRCIDVLSPDYLTDVIIDVIAALLQLGLRLYLKFVQKIHLSKWQTESVIQIISFSIRICFTRVILILRIILFVSIDSCYPNLIHL